MNQVPDWLSYDPANEIVTIDGFRFTRELFSQLTTSPIGVCYRVIERQDGVITVSTERDPLEVAATDLLAALKAVVRTRDKVSFDQARAAIAKAEGRS